MQQNVVACTSVVKPTKTKHTKACFGICQTGQKYAKLFSFTKDT